MFYETHKLCFVWLFTLTQLLMNFTQDGIFMVGVAENRSFITFKSILQFADKLKVWKEALLRVDILVGMTDSIPVPFGQLHFMMRELECHLFIWLHSLIERKSHTARLKVYEMKRELPFRHRILQTIRIKIYPIIQETPELFLQTCILGCHRNLKPLSLEMIQSIRTFPR